MMLSICKHVEVRIQFSRFPQAELLAPVSVVICLGRMGS